MIMIRAYSVMDLVIMEATAHVRHTGAGDVLVEPVGVFIGRRDYDSGDLSGARLGEMVGDLCAQANAEIQCCWGGWYTLL